MKKLLIFMLALVMVFSCCACNNNENNPPANETISLTPATHHVASYRVNEWRIEGTKDYYTVLATYSKDFYDQITADDILYYTDEYKPFAEVFPGCEIVVYNISTADTGIGAYIKIHTNRLIDLQKVFIVTEGPETHIDGIITKDEFLAAGNDESKWIKFYTSISSKQTPFDDIDALNNSKNVAVLSAPDFRAYCDATNYEITREDNKITVKLPYDLFTVKNETAITDALSTAFALAATTDGVVTQIKKPEGLEIIGSFDDEYLYINIQTVGEKSLDEYELEYLINISSPNMKIALTTE